MLHAKAYQHSLVGILDLAELGGVSTGQSRVRVKGFGFLQVCLLQFLISTVWLHTKQGIAVLDTCRLE